MIKTYDHIIWDWNGTLLNDVELCLSIINNIISKRDLPAISIKYYQDIFTFPVKEYYQKAGLDFSNYSFELLGMEWIMEYENRKHEAQLFPYALSTLRSIQESGTGQSILSAYSQKDLVEIIEYFHLNDFFQHVSGLDHIYATSKIDLGIKLVDKLNIPNKKILLIGDTIHDFEVSKAIGADCVLIAEGHQSKSRLMNCGVPVLSSLMNINSFLGINQAVL